jgi:hypothetical protein
MHNNTLMGARYIVRREEKQFEGEKKREKACITIFTYCTSPILPESPNCLTLLWLPPILQPHPLTTPPQFAAEEREVFDQETSISFMNTKTNTQLLLLLLLSTSSKDKAAHSLQLDQEPRASILRSGRCCPL